MGRMTWLPGAAAAACLCGALAGCPAATNNVASCAALSGVQLLNCRGDEKTDQTSPPRIVAFRAAIQHQPLSAVTKKSAVKTPESETKR